MRKNDDLVRIKMVFDCVDMQGEIVKERIRAMAKDKLENLEQGQQDSGTMQEAAMEQLNSDVGNSIADRVDTLRSEDTLTRDERQEETRGHRGVPRKRRGGSSFGRKPFFRRPWPIVAAASLALVVCVAGFGLIASSGSDKANYSPESARNFDLFDNETSQISPSSEIADKALLESERSEAGGSEPAGQAGASVDEAMGKKIIYTAQASLKVNDVAVAMRDIEARTVSLGGYIAQSSYTENDGRGSISIKVPQNKYTEFKDGLALWGTVLELKQSSNDVGLQYFDTEARMKNLEAQEQRYLEILQGARTIDEILKVEKSLSEVRVKIESYKGQLRYWDNQVDYAQLTLTLRQANQDLTAPVKDPWEPMSFSKTLTACKNAFLKTISTLWNGLNYLLVMIAYLLPVLVVGGVVWAIFWTRKRKRRRKQQTEGVDTD
ncbi:MAG: DUF4349 domain-containing protein [Gracilibacteraceae bacterium]|jgi:hypothetical protein|nr:DUF4349 domain-containing protein [Gracilibacteraceae bacterium]